MSTPMVPATPENIDAVLADLRMFGDLVDLSHKTRDMCRAALEGNTWDTAPFVVQIREQLERIERKMIDHGAMPAPRAVRRVKLSDLAHDVSMELGFCEPESLDAVVRGLRNGRPRIRVIDLEDDLPENHTYAEEESNGC